MATFQFNEYRLKVIRFIFCQHTKCAPRYWQYLKFRAVSESPLAKVCQDLKSQMADGKLAVEDISANDVVKFQIR